MARKKTPAKKPKAAPKKKKATRRRAPKPVALHFEKLSRFDRAAEPCTVAVPFAEGALAVEGGEFRKVAVCDGKRELPTQSRVTATWPDGSVKWLLVHFLADLPGGEPKDLELRFGTEPPQPDTPVGVREDPAGGLTVSGGALTIRLAAAHQAGLVSLASAGGFSLADSEFTGPRLTNELGETFTACVGERGWEIVEAGPVRAALATAGSHRSPGGDRKWIDYEARVYAWSGKPWLRLDYRIINREAPEETTIESIDLGLQPEGADPARVRTSLGTSNYQSRIRTGEAGETHEFLIDADHLLYAANEQIPEVNFGVFWADWCDPDKGGACVALHQAYQNFPKRLRVSGAGGVAAELLPGGAGGLRMIRGMAKTHRVFYHLHGPETSPEELNVRALQLEMPDRPVLEPEVYKAAGVTEDVFAPKPVPRVERYLVDLADRRCRGYGILHWGDGPDVSYTEQGRGLGEPVWTNGEYDLAHAAMLNYVRTAERRMLDYMLVAAEHWMDVDVCHHSPDPMRMGGQLVHSARHATAGATPSHEWVEGLLDYYHQTGERAAYEAAAGIAGNVLRQCEGKPHLRVPAGSAARETGWALRTFVAMYVETHDESWMAPAEFIVSQFEAWAAEHGAWLAPYTDHTLARVPFMIAVAASSLMRYWRVRPEKRVGKMICAAMDDLLENCLTGDGRFYYKELPSLRQRAAGTYVLESLAYAYEISGRKKYLEAGMTSFELAVGASARGNIVGRKYVAGDAVVWEAGASPKSFAASFMPVVTFYRAAAAAGMLK